MGRAHTFLIVDDNEDNRILTRYALRKAFRGSQVLETDSIDEALRLARDHAPDGIVTDHHLGTQNGKSFVGDLKTAGVTCPVVMVTASSDPAVHQRAYDAGASRVFAGSDVDFIGYFRRLFRPD